VESCTAIAEHEDGTFELITWQNILETEPVGSPVEEMPRALGAQAA
jgi:hypothetical protein